MADKVRLRGDARLGAIAWLDNNRERVNKYLKDHDFSELVSDTKMMPKDVSEAISEGMCDALREYNKLPLLGHLLDCYYLY